MTLVKLFLESFTNSLTSNILLIPNIYLRSSVVWQNLGTFPIEKRNKLCGCLKYSRRSLGRRSKLLERKCLHSTNDAFEVNGNCFTTDDVFEIPSSTPLANLRSSHRGSHLALILSEQQASLSMYSTIIYKCQTLSVLLYDTDFPTIKLQPEAVNQINRTSRENWKLLTLLVYHEFSFM